MSERNIHFDRIVNRRGTGCLKYDFAVERGMKADVLPMWVADMDFPTSSFVQDAIIEQARHGIYGYDEGKDDYFNAVSCWIKKQMNWEVKKEWLVKTPGVVFALAMAVKAFSKEGEAVMINQPVYYPFRDVILSNRRKLVNSPLVCRNGHYELDFEDIEKKIVEEKVVLYILCSPHNPVGRVWTRGELERLFDICLRHHVFVVSDEIHSDFIHQGTHTSYGLLGKRAMENSVVCTSPGKTFNLAGLQISNIWIPDETNRKKFRHEIQASGYSQVNSVGLVACRAAYESGRTWYEQMLSYVEENIAFMNDYIRTNMERAVVFPTEGTYLVWVDFRGYGLSEKELDEKISSEAGVWLDKGSMFGPEGAGFFRFNVACPHSVVKEALDKIKNVLEIKAGT